MDKTVRKENAMKKHRKVWILVLIIGAVVFASVFSIYGVLRARRWKGIYYGESNGVHCEILCTNDTYKNLKQYFYFKTFHNEVYYLEGWIKFDKNLGKIYDVSVKGGDSCASAFSRGGPNYSDPLPTGKWIKYGFGYAAFDKGTDVSNLKNIQIEVLFVTPPNKENYVSIQLHKAAHPPVLPPCKPVPHSPENP